MRAARARCNYANFNHYHPSFNFEKKKNISYVFLFLRNFKISFSSVFTVTLFYFREKSEKKTLQLISIKFVYVRLPDLRSIARIAWRVAPEKQCLS